MSEWMNWETLGCLLTIIAIFILTLILLYLLSQTPLFRW
jgi:hypothetical protein